MYQLEQPPKKDQTWDWSYNTKPRACDFLFCENYYISDIQYLEYNRYV